MQKIIGSDFINSKSSAFKYDAKDKYSHYVRHVHCDICQHTLKVLSDQQVQRHKNTTSHQSKLVKKERIEKTQQERIYEIFFANYVPLKYKDDNIFLVSNRYRIDVKNKRVINLSDVIIKKQGNIYVLYDDKRRISEKQLLEWNI